MAKPQIILLDSYCMNPGDLDWAALEKLGHVVNYEYTKPDEIVDRAQGCDILVVNKTIIDEEVMQQLPWLKCICVTATGYNNIDLTAAKSMGITVCNVSGYGTPSVGQHVFALLLELTNQVALHANTVRQNKWHHNRDFCYWEKPITELSGKTMGIYGMGKIGREVAKIAMAFGMHIIYNSRTTKDCLDMRAVDITELFSKSDVLCLTANLTKENFKIVSKYNLDLMKPTAYLINTSRGDLIDEEDLLNALLRKNIAGAALDVLANEPPEKNHPLTQLSNCFVTPHIAWASREARQRLLRETVENIKAYLRGMPVNVIRDS